MIEASGLADAERHGISYVELNDAAGGDLVAFMAEKIKKAIHKEEKRLAGNGS